MTADEYNSLGQRAEGWFCDHCKSVMANRVKWGTLESEEVITNEIDAAYKNYLLLEENFFSITIWKGRKRLR